jgi:hypothetical protein
LSEQYKILFGTYVDQTPSSKKTCVSLIFIKSAQKRMGKIGSISLKKHDFRKIAPKDVDPIKYH